MEILKKHMSLLNIFFLLCGLKRGTISRQGSITVRRKDTAIL